MWLELCNHFFSLLPKLNAPSHFWPLLPLQVAVLQRLTPVYFPLYTTVKNAASLLQELDHVGLLLAVGILVLHDVNFLGNDNCWLLFDDDHLLWWRGRWKNNNNLLL